MTIAEFWQYAFFQNAMLASLLCGVSCSVIGVFIVTMRIPFIGVAMSHASMTGAVFALLLGINPFWSGFALAAATSLAVGPLTDRIRMDPNISLGIIFSLCMGLAFLGIGLAAEPKNEMMGLVWGNILLLSRPDLLRMALITFGVLLVTVLFYKEFKAVIFSRSLAAAVGIRERLVYYMLLLLCGATVTANLDTVGGLMLFSMIINPAAAAYQLTYKLNILFFIAAGFGIISAGMGLMFSAFFNLPSGSCVVICSCALFGLVLMFSPKRKQAKYGSTA